MALSKADAGRKFSGPSKTLTDAHFLMYAAISGDTHPIHYDVEYAKNTPFRAPIAHGLLLTGLMALGGSNAGDVCDGLAMVEQGTRYLRPVKVGDTVHPEFEIEDVWRDDKQRSFCRFKTLLLNHKGETMAEGFHVYRILAKPDGKKDGE